MSWIEANGASLRYDLSGSGRETLVLIHEGAQHGYALPNRDIFDPHGAARDWEQIFAMFHRRIPPYEA